MFKNKILIISLFLNYSCVMHNVAMDSARVLKPHEKKAGLAYHHSYTQDRNTLKERISEKLRINDYKSDLKYGLSLYLRSGIFTNFDVGGHVSLDSLSLDGKYQIYDSSKYSSSFSTKLQVPTFSVDKILAFAPVLTLYNSFYFHPSLEFFINPFYIYYLDYVPQRHSLGASVGVFLGSCQRFSLAYTYEQLVNNSIKESSEQLSFGLNFYNFNPSKRLVANNKKSLNHRIFLTTGVLWDKFFSLGLLSSHSFSHKKYLEFIIKIAWGLQKESLNEKYMKSSSEYLLLLSRLSLPLVFVENIHSNIGLGRREMTFSFESEGGWKQVQVTNHGLSLSFSYDFPGVSVDFFDLFIPLFLNTSKYYYPFDKNWQASNDYLKLGQKWKKRISLSLVDFKFSL